MMGIAVRFGDIWDSIAAEANANADLLPLTQEQKAELDRRVAEYEADPSAVIPMAECYDIAADAPWTTNTPLSAAGSG